MVFYRDMMIGNLTVNSSIDIWMFTLAGRVLTETVGDVVHPLTVAAKLLCPPRASNIGVINADPEVVETYAIGRDILNQLVVESNSEEGAVICDFWFSNRSRWENRDKTALIAIKFFKRLSTGSAGMVMVRRVEMCLWPNINTIKLAVTQLTELVAGDWCKFVAGPIRAVVDCIFGAHPGPAPGLLLMTFIYKISSE